MYMEALTYSVVVSIGTRESIDLLVALLESGGTVEQLTARTGMAEPTASRRLKDLAAVGLVYRERPRDPYALTSPDETRELLEKASALSARVLELRREKESGFVRRVRKSRFRDISTSGSPRQGAHDQPSDA